MIQRGKIKDKMPFRIKFLVQLPTLIKDFDYVLHHDQVLMGSIILSHYPLEKREEEILESAYSLCKISKIMGGIL